MPETINNAADTLLREVMERCLHDANCDYLATVPFPCNCNQRDLHDRIRAHLATPAQPAATEQENHLIELLRRAHIHLGFSAYSARDFREKLGKDAPDFIINSLADIESLVSDISAVIKSYDH